ncbi:hypothetical protein K2173_005010 [Erythroxylum novogranatense]|uniref:Amino acid transporter transmembrane domain-containing protein n=1 Tax=Erythroxylum novogranatense TaxID=1862640 RepID=A0AAV8TCU8_9ROSI|nr:hypothetical protein K2173_005010 [Erythroxylum novogranatense]
MPAARNSGDEIISTPLLVGEREEDQEQSGANDQLNLEAGDKYSPPLERNNHQERIHGDTSKTAHQINEDSWANAAAVLITCNNSAYILSYSESIMVHLGWRGGVVGLFVATALSLYASTLPAKLHQLGGRRHIRYRDLAGYIYGKKGYNILWLLQYLNLFMASTGFIILAGSVIQGVCTLFMDDKALKISYCNLIAGLTFFIFAIMVPHLSALASWLRISAFLTAIYVFVTLALCIRDGIKAPTRDYNIPGTQVGLIFMTIGSISNLFVPLNAGMIPEIQATLKAPVVENMMKALYAQFTLGVIPIYAVILIGYWAYGSGTSSYLLNNASGPIWAKALANIAAFLQSIINFHIMACPSYEYFDTKYEVKGGAFAPKALSFRIKIRGSYLIVSSLVAAILPFIGDFIGLIGSICVVPLTFVIPNHMYLTIKKNLNSVQKLWHWFNVIIFSILSVAATVASVRLIVIDSKNYKIFGD